MYVEYITRLIGRLKPVAKDMQHMYVSFCPNVRKISRLLFKSRPYNQAGTGDIAIGNGRQLVLTDPTITCLLYLLYGIRIAPSFIPALA